MQDIKLFTRDPYTGVITLTPPDMPMKVKGKDKLVQIVLLALLNNPGRNVFFPERGSGLPGLIGQSNFDPNDPTELIADISERIEKIKEEIIDAQSNLVNETPSERLQDLILLNIDPGTQIDEVVVKFRIVSEAGDAIDIVI